MSRADWLRAMPMIVQALVGLGVGVWTTWAGLRGIRRRPEHPIDGVAWEERPLPIRQQDAMVGAFIGLHGAGHGALAVLALVDAMRGPDPSSVPPGVSPTVVFWVGMLGLLVAWVLAGVTLGFPLVYRRTALVPVRFGPYGFQHGARVVGWEGFSHFAVDLPGRVIRAYGARMPDVAKGVWHPPTEALCAQAAAVLDGVLPRAHTPRPGAPAAPHRWAPVAWLLAGMAPLLLGGVLLAGHWWSGAYFAAAAVATMQLGNSVLHHFGLD
ncbi:hypothetical protein [Roseisolibacter agri]|uniref:Uncharacterized protein n=1 Tax=Roseisolibacter agri TaxID=2014610 RepID=A0AA37VAK3_9BACT|nr:hypothetical protein [Roseisolibacter agri]GLC25528.1 hypothetical protein rosag_20410 [Roseisolibacter agri]